MRKSPELKRKNLLKTTVIEDFLRNEFDNCKTFQSTFGTFEEFERVMGDVTKSCTVCAVITWKGCDPRCFCTYEQTMK